LGIGQHRYAAIAQLSQGWSLQGRYHCRRAAQILFAERLETPLAIAV